MPWSDKELVAVSK
jgi:hypothetical protein